ncbi:MAG: hypothetical protein Q8N91_05265, partial [Candidatus Omnitrophota bacterium]|nr:hypothetical protein [Candidatus Omnitrophota bacterium]
ITALVRYHDGGITESELRSVSAGTFARIDAYLPGSKYLNPVTEESHIDIFRRLAKNTSPIQDAPPRVANPALSIGYQELDSALQDLNRRTSARGIVDTRSLFAALIEANRLLRISSSEGQIGTMPSFILALVWLENMAFRALREARESLTSDGEDLLDKIYKTLWFAETVEFYLRIHSDGYLFESVVTEKKRNLRSSEKATDAYRKLAKEGMSLVERWSKRYSRERRKDLQDALWSGNLIDSFIMLADTSSRAVPSQRLHRRRVQDRDYLWGIEEGVPETAPSDENATAEIASPVTTQIPPPGLGGTGFLPHIFEGIAVRLDGPAPLILAGEQERQDREVILSGLGIGEVPHADPRIPAVLTRLDETEIAALKAMADRWGKPEEKMRQRLDEALEEAQGRPMQQETGQALAAFAGAVDQNRMQAILDRGQAEITLYADRLYNTKEEHIAITPLKALNSKSINDNITPLVLVKIAEREDVNPLELMHYIIKKNNIRMARQDEAALYNKALVLDTLRKIGAHYERTERQDLNALSKLLADNLSFEDLRKLQLQLNDKHSQEFQGLLEKLFIVPLIERPLQTTTYKDRYHQHNSILAGPRGLAADIIRNKSESGDRVIRVGSIGTADGTDLIEVAEIIADELGEGLIAEQWRIIIDGYDISQSNLTKFKSTAREDLPSSFETNSIATVLGNELDRRAIKDTHYDILIYRNTAQHLNSRIRPLVSECLDADVLLLSTGWHLTGDYSSYAEVHHGILLNKSSSLQANLLRRQDRQRRGARPDAGAIPQNAAPSQAPDVASISPAILGQKGMGVVGESESKDGLGLCLTPDSLIHLPDGTTKPLIQIKPGEEVLSLNEKTKKLEPHKVNALLEMGVKPVYRIRTQSGKELKTTLNHPYLTREGWRKLKEIKIGEEIAVIKEESPFAVSVFPRVNTINNDNEADDIKTDTILSYSKSMGSRRNINQGFGEMHRISGRQIQINFLQNAILQLVRKFFKFSSAGRGKLNRIHHRPVQDNPNLCLIFSNGTNPIFLASAMPFFNLNTSLGLTGRWASMASMSQPTGLWNTYSLEETVSSNLVSKAQSMSQSEYVSKTKYLGEPVLFTTTAALNSFDDISSFNSSGNAANFFIDTNFTGSLADNFTKDLDFIFYSPPYGVKYNTALSKLSRALSLRHSVIIYEHIVSIEYLGPQQVYDIEVEGTHNFVAQGIVAHNTYTQTPPNSPFRFPDYIWQNFKGLLQSHPDADIYNIAKTSGLAWTDAVGNIHYIDEKLTPNQAQEVWEYAKQAIETSTGKTIESAGKVKEVVAYHESLHAKFRDRKYKELIKSFKQKLEAIYPGISLSEDHPFITSFRNTYGKP